ncbi:DUF349 domain-containing protein [Pelagibaculum spongiae]|uniref:DUF349 domain-containing protein n=1 Tax=Pelagibaculum spongiae TaxID=2080658 RepID=A0A2V1GVA9_9GAMM|nr:DUF349 domain-containing protein [Pelagibaculum spongiae]PVZ70268.1 hypothetical protein DC094_06630 [Pelagibaculum spongiae]
MILDKLFKPKWQNSRPETRIRALKDMDCGTAENANIISNLAFEDSNTAVRCIAIARLNQIDRLIKLTQDGQKKISDAARERLGLFILGRAGQLDLTDRHQLMQKLQPLGDGLIIHIMQGGDAGLQAALVEQTKDDLQLVELALTASTTKVRQLAANQIEKLETLEELARKCRGKDKSVLQICRDKLKKHQQQLQQLQQAKADFQKLIDQISKLSRQDSDPLYEGKVAHLQQSWDRLSKEQPEIGQQMHSAFAEKMQLCQNQLDQWQQARQLEIQKQQQIIEAGENQQQICHLLDTALDERQQVVDFTEQDIQLTRSLLQLQEHCWHESCEIQKAADELARQYHRLSQLLHVWVNAAENYLKLQPELTRVIEEDHQHLSKIIDQVRWPTELPAPALIHQANGILAEVRQQKAQVRQEQQNQAAQLRQEMDQLAKLLDCGELKQARKMNRQLHKDLKASPKLPDQLRKQLHVLEARLYELEDWQGYATLPKQQQLIDNMEQLIDSELPAEALADQIHQLQMEWKELGGSGQKQWKQFSDAADKAFIPCKKFFEQRNLVRQQNLQQRQVIVDELTAFYEQTDWETVDWNALETILRTARDEWSKYQEVDPKNNRKVHRQFDRILKKLREKLDGFRKQNYDLKQALVEQAQSLIELPEDDALAQAKELQSQWKAIPLTWRRDEHKLWRNFHTACEAIFTARKENYQARKQVKQQGFEQAEQVLQGIQQQFEQAGDSKALRANLKQATQQIEQALPGQRDRSKFDQQLQLLEQQLIQQQQKMQQQNLVQRFEQIKQAAFSQDPVESFNTLTEQDKKAFAQRNHQPLVSEALLREKTVELEILCGHISPEQDQALRLQLQVARLANSLGQTTQAESSLVDQAIAAAREILLLQKLDEHEHQSYIYRVEQAIVFLLK